MPTKPSYGPAVQNRTKWLLEALLLYANDNFGDWKCRDLEVRWQNENQLVVRTKITALKALIHKHKTSNNTIKPEEIKESIGRLKDFLEILEDHRTTTQGAHIWHFTLKLWSKDIEVNLRQFDLQWQLRKPEKSPGGLSASVLELSNQDWDNAPDTSVFFGRTHELAQLQQWIVSENYQLVTVLGIGGIGKTVFIVKLAQQIQDSFDYIIWRSLKDAPPLQKIVGELIQFLSNGRATNYPKNIDDQIPTLMNYLRQYRCLVILDNLEPIFLDGEFAGHYRTGYEGYGRLIKLVGETTHKSCLILTSREKPRELDELEGKEFRVCSLQLQGVGLEEGEEILKSKGSSLFGNPEHWNSLISLFKGNPLALKIVYPIINEFFHGNISDFLIQRITVYPTIEELIKQHFSRLQDVEKQIMYWLSIEREPVSIAELNDDIFSIDKIKFMQGLSSLWQRSLIEKIGKNFTLHPMVMEYVTENLIDEFCKDILEGRVTFLNRYAWIKAMAIDKIRETQALVIIKRIAELMSYRSNKNLKNLLIKLIAYIRENLSLDRQWYAVGNILNFLSELQIDLTNYDFSGLKICQAYLQGKTLQGVNFRGSEFCKCIFTQNFGSVFSVAFNPDGKSFAIGDSKGEIYLWQVEGIRQLLVCKRHGNWVRAVAFSPDGQILASGGEDKTIKLWDSKTGECLKTLTGHTGRVRAIAFSPDGSLLSSGSEDGTIKLWSVKLDEDSPLATWQAHHGWVRSIAYSPDGKILASGSEDQTVKLWDIGTSQCQQTLNSGSRVKSIAFSPDGQILAIGGEDGAIKIWFINKTDDPEILSGHQEQVWSLAFSPDGQILASSSFDKTVRLWNIHERECKRILQGHTGWVRSVTFSPDGEILVSAGADQTVKLWNPLTGECLRTLRGYSNWMRSVAFSPDGQTLASGGDEKAIRLWDINSGQCRQSFDEHINCIWLVVYSPDGQTIASSSEDGTIKLWDVKKGVCLNTLRGHNSWVRSVAFSPDGRFLASSSDDRTVKLWDLLTGKCLNTMTKHTGRVRSVAFHPDGSSIASGSEDGTIKLWDTHTGECLRTFLGNAGRVWSVAFSPDGLTLAMGSDTAVSLWNVLTGECQLTLTGHSDLIRSVAFSPDGLTLASGSEDRAVKLWNINTRECQRNFLEHTGRVWSVSFSPSAPILASSSEDGTIRLWNIHTGHCLQTLKVPLPYEGMNITGIKGLTESQKVVLRDLGAVEE